MSVRLKARARAILGIEPWPDLAVRHRLFRAREYRDLRALARPFDTPKPTKPVIERHHQASYVVARWFVDGGVRSAFHAGYASGRYVFYLSRIGIVAGGTDLPPDETGWNQVPPLALDEETRRRLLPVDFFKLTPAHVASVWGSAALPIGVLFSEATFETLLPWREEHVSVEKYKTMDAGVRRELMHRSFPEKLAELQGCFRNMVFIEPEPTAGGAGEIFEACARRLPEFSYSVWSFRPPLDRLFRLSPRHPTRQTVYAYVRDHRLLEALRAYAEPRRRTSRW